MAQTINAHLCILSASIICRSVSSYNCKTDTPYACPKRIQKNIININRPIAAKAPRHQLQQLNSRGYKHGKDEHFPDGTEFIMHQRQQDPKRKEQGDVTQHVL